MRLTVAQELERLRTLRDLRGDRPDPVPSILTIDDSVKAIGSRHRCSLCHCEIPPGRPGRKCQQCRTWYQCDCTGSPRPDFCVRCDKMMEPIVDDETAKGPKERPSLKEFVETQFLDRAASPSWSATLLIVDQVLNAGPVRLVFEKPRRS